MCSIYYIHMELSPSLHLKRKKNHKILDNTGTSPLSSPVFSTEQKFLN